MTYLYRAIDSQYAAGREDRGWKWWTPSIRWARGYGRKIVRRHATGLNLLNLPLDGPDVLVALDDAGIDCADIAPTIDCGGEETPREVHMILTDRIDGPALASRLRAAGYHGVRHPDHVYGRGIGTAVALIIS